LSEPRWHPEAIADLESARDWYAVRSPFAARGFLLTLDEAVLAIARRRVVGPSASSVVGATSLAIAIRSRSSTAFSMTA